MNVLFVCSENRLRSPTAEAIFSHYEELDTRSAGISPMASNRVSADLVEWADAILVMEETHRQTIEREFGALLQGTRLEVLDIPDRFAYMQPELVEILEAEVPRHLHLQ